DVDPRCVEDLSVRFILIESQIQKIALIHSGRRAAPRIFAPDADLLSAEGQGIAIALVVLSLVAQERADVARDGIPEAHDLGTDCTVDQLVELVRLEPVEQADVARSLDEAAGPSGAGSKRPLVRGNRYLGSNHVIADGQIRVRGIQVAC